MADENYQVIDGNGVLQTFSADDTGAGVLAAKPILRLSTGTVSGANPVPVTDSALAGTLDVNLTEILGSAISSSNCLPVNLEQVNGASIALGSGNVSVTTIRVVQASDSVPGTVVDNTAFTDGTTRVYMQGYIFDDVAGTALTENDAAAARIDSKRAVVSTIEDATTRGQRLAISAGGAASVSLTTAIPAGSNNIGDVDVLSVVPGTGATNLGKAVDGASGGTDTGVIALAVRDDALSTLTPADDDYTQLRVDSQGRIWTNGQVAHDSAVAGAPVRIGGRARTSDITAVASDDQTDAITDTVGKQIVLPYSIPENFVYGVTSAITDTTNTSVIASAGSGRINYVTSITVTNSHATVGTVVEIRDGASTVMHRGYAAPLGGGYTVTFPTPLRGTAATAVTASCITTGSNVYVSANGYTAP